MNNIVKQFVVILMNSFGLKEHIVNCNNANSAKLISEEIFKGYRVIDIFEK